MKSWIDQAVRDFRSGNLQAVLDGIVQSMPDETAPFDADEIVTVAGLLLGVDQNDLSNQLLSRLAPEDWTPELRDLASSYNLAFPRESSTSRAASEKGSRPLRVAMISVSDSGGAGTSAYRLHQGLRKIGVESTMYVAMKRRDDPTVMVLPPDRGTGEVVDGLPQDAQESVWNAATERWRRNIAPYPARPSGLETFTDAISTARIDRVRGILDADIVNFHWIAGIVDTPTLAGLLKEKPSVWTLHDIHAFAGGCHYSAGCLGYRAQCGACPALGSQQENDLSRSTWNTRRELYEAVPLDVVTPSRWLQQEALSSTLFGNKPVHHIPYGLPLEVFQPGDRMLQREQLHLSPGEKVILFGADSVGNMRKGFQLLVKGLMELDGMLSADQKITLVTFGRMAPQLSLPSRFRVVHLGQLNGEQKIADVYSAADLFVIPSLEDNLPNTVLESLACGTPVAGFGIGGIPDMVEHKKTGYIAKPFDVKDLATGIQWVLWNDELPSIRDACRARAEADYPLTRQADRYLELFSSLM